jgi:hypothetical protein
MYVYVVLDRVWTNQGLLIREEIWPWFMYIS